MSDSGGLIKELESRQLNAVRQKCSFTRIKESMSLEEREAVENAVSAIKSDTGNGRAKVYSCSWLSEVLSNNGYQISESTLSRHLAGRCGCE